MYNSILSFCFTIFQTAITVGIIVQLCILQVQILNRHTTTTIIQKHFKYFENKFITSPFIFTQYFV